MRSQSAEPSAFVPLSFGLYPDAQRQEPKLFTKFLFAPRQIQVSAPPLLNEVGPHLVQAP
jgi:hypothetical protein